ncbi:lipoprotein [Streptomyces fumigatiscleroticus]|nr:lipoprotein [Streptomyces fumigatiscleroticus]
MRRTAFAVLGIVAATTVGLTGCQSGQDGKDGKDDGHSASASAASASAEPFAGLSGAEIADRALAATTGASSLRMKGDIPDDESGDTISIDMALNREGECAGTLSIGGQGKAELIKTGDTLYMKYDEAFLRAQNEGEPEADTDAAVAMLAGKWTSMAAKGQDAKDIAGFCDLDSVLGDAEDTGSNATRGETTTVDGTPALVLHEKDGADRYTVYVATEGKPYLLRVDSSSAKDPGSIAFGDYDKPVAAERPGGEIVDLDALGG